MNASDAGRCRWRAVFAFHARDVQIPNFPFRDRSWHLRRPSFSVDDVERHRIEGPRPHSQRLLHGDVCIHLVRLLYLESFPLGFDRYASRDSSTLLFPNIYLHSHPRPTARISADCSSKDWIVVSCSWIVTSPVCVCNAQASICLTFSQVMRSSIPVAPPSPRGEPSPCAAVTADVAPRRSNARSRPRPGLDGDEW